MGILIFILLFKARILGEQCVTDIQCIANNASCVDSICKCEIDFYNWDEATCAKSIVLVLLFDKVLKTMSKI